MTDSEPSFVIGISSVSGGGKTATAEKLAILLSDAVTLCFDDYDNSNLHPENLQEWFQQGGDYNAWKTPTLTTDVIGFPDFSVCKSLVRVGVFQAL